MQDINPYFIAVSYRYSPQLLLIQQSIYYISRHKVMRAINAAI